jgi:hypothetical protein
VWSVGPVAAAAPATPLPDGAARPVGRAALAAAAAAAVAALDGAARPVGKIGAVQRPCAARWRAAAAAAAVVVVAAASVAAVRKRGGLGKVGKTQKQ